MAVYVSHAGLHGWLAKLESIAEHIKHCWPCKVVDMKECTWHKAEVYCSIVHVQVSCCNPVAYINVTVHIHGSKLPSLNQPRAMHSAVEKA